MKEASLKYHREPVPGKIEITTTKPCENQNDLSLAYTPGVAAPCLEIAKHEDLVYEYTGKGNLVAVISDGTAVLGLGDIGPAAGKPVMEGKSVLFKRFGGVNAFDIELAEKDPDKLIEIIASMEPSFGGINLEDISSPRCFKIERELIKRMNIPVFHDDQHGTAVIAGAGVINALDIFNKDISKIKVAMSGAGAAAVSIAEHLVALGVNRNNIFAADSKGVLYNGRDEMKSIYHEVLYRDTDARKLADIMDGADLFIGVSVKGLVSKDMIKSMAKHPIIFPMANPDPEITYEEVKSVCPDSVIGTGRSDYPNQVNNVLGFPAIFRGALDIRARAITENMKIAATHALARVARMDVPENVLKAYGLKELKFGADYVIPKPFDRRVLVEEAGSVAEAGIKDGVARIDIDIDEYKKNLAAKWL